MQGLNVYETQGHEADMDQLIRQHATLVLKLAKSIKRKLPSYIDLNDLLQSGFVGLIEASKTYKPDQGASFETFASIRIKGAIIDDLRKNSWGDRGSSTKELGEAVSRVEQRTQQPATAEAVAEEMHITLEEYDKLCQRINVNYMQSMDNLEELNLLPGTEETPEEVVTKDNLKDYIKTILQTFPERERQLLSLYYIEELTFKDIAEVLNLTEARICQLHAAALAKIKKRLDM